MPAWPAGRAAAVEYVYARGGSGARQLCGELPARLSHECGVAYYLIETGVGLQKSQSVGGGFCHHHLASAALEAFLERAVVSGRVANEQCSLGGRLGQKCGAICVRDSQSFFWRDAVASRLPAL